MLCMYAAHSSQIPTGYLYSATQIFFINYTKYAYYFFFFICSPVQTERKKKQFIYMPLECS